MSCSPVAILPILTQSFSVSNGTGWERLIRVSGLSETGGVVVGEVPVLLQERNTVITIRDRIGILIWRIFLIIPAANYTFYLVYRNSLHIVFKRSARGIMI
jgi:hypothetical protein